MHPLTAFSHLQNGPLAIGTVRGEELMVVLFTVRAALSLKELAVAQLLAARCAHKVLGVPHLTQRRDYLWEEGKPSQILDHPFFLFIYIYILHCNLFARLTFPTMLLLQ